MNVQTIIIDHLRSGSFPGPGDGVQLVGIPDANGLDRHSRVERPRLEGYQARAIRARALGENHDLQSCQSFSQQKIYYLTRRA